MKGGSLRFGRDDRLNTIYKETQMERKGVVTMKGTPVTLIGPEIKVGDKAPEFACLSSELKTVTLADTAGKTRLFASVPSLDTPVCSLETTRFNKEAETLPADKVAVQVISVDLPFAQKRFCSMEGIKNVKVISDHKDLSFGNAYGVLMAEFRFLSRAIFVVDGGGVVRYVQYVKEVGEHPDYEAALAAVRKVAGI